MCSAGCQHVGFSRNCLSLVKRLHHKPGAPVSKLNKRRWDSYEQLLRRRASRHGGDSLAIRALHRAAALVFVVLLSESADAGVCDLCVSVHAAAGV